MQYDNSIESTREPMSIHRTHTKSNDARFESRHRVKLMSDRRKARRFKIAQRIEQLTYPNG
jgi:hypothetical protein